VAVRSSAAARFTAGRVRGFSLVDSGSASPPVGSACVLMGRDGARDVQCCACPHEEWSMTRDRLKNRAERVVSAETASADGSPEGLDNRRRRSPDRLARDRGSGRGRGRVVATGTPSSERPRYVASQPAPATSATAAGYPFLGRIRCEAGYPPRGRSSLLRVRCAPPALRSPRARIGGLDPA
jgi:hypothetical protein